MKISWICIFSFKKKIIQKTIWFFKKVYFYKALQIYFTNQTANKKLLRMIVWKIQILKNIMEFECLDHFDCSDIKISETFFHENKSSSLRKQIKKIKNWTFDCRKRKLNNQLNWIFTVRGCEFHAVFKDVQNELNIFIKINFLMNLNIFHVSLINSNTFKKSKYIGLTLQL